MKEIRIQYLDETIEKLTYIDGKSDWIDLRSAKDVELKAGECSYRKVTKHTLFRVALPIKISVSFRQITAESLTALTAVRTTGGICLFMRFAIRLFIKMTVFVSSVSWKISRSLCLMKSKS